ncbi:helix-turn-helix domain-containing protein [Streptomyces sp. NPDC004592]
MARGLADFNPFELRAHRMNLHERAGRKAMSAEELARAVGATKAQILAYENGHRVPDPQRIRALARALNVHPWFLMRVGRREDWAVADLRRACALRADDVVRELGISPKIYRRFELEGIVPSRRPQFLDEVAKVFGISRRVLERAMDKTPAVRERMRRSAELVESLADRYVTMPGPWRGPVPTDSDLIELAKIYGRPLTRTRRVIAYELGELRFRYVRAMRERVIADFDIERTRQASARQAAHRWDEIFVRDLARIPGRLEVFHRNAQPSDVWQLLVDLYNADAQPRGEGLWAVGRFLADDTTVLPPSLVDQQRVEDVTLCRLSAQGLAHVSRFAGLYASLYPITRKPLKTGRTASRKGSAQGGTFTLSNQQLRLVIPQPFLEKLQLDAAATRAKFVTLNERYLLMIHPTSLGVTVLATPADDGDLPPQVSLFEWDDENPE